MKSLNKRPNLTYTQYIASYTLLGIIILYISYITVNYFIQKKRNNYIINESIPEFKCKNISRHDKYSYLENIYRRNNVLKFSARSLYRMDYYFFSRKCIATAATEKSILSLQNFIFSCIKADIDLLKIQIDVENLKRELFVFTLYVNYGYDVFSEQLVLMEYNFDKIFFEYLQSIESALKIPMVIEFDSVIIKIKDLQKKCQKLGKMKQLCMVLFSNPSYKYQLKKIYSSIISGYLLCMEQVINYYKKSNIVTS